MIHLHKYVIFLNVTHKKQKEIFNQVSVRVSRDEFLFPFILLNNKNNSNDPKMLCYPASRISSPRRSCTTLYELTSAIRTYNQWNKRTKKYDRETIEPLLSLLDERGIKIPLQREGGKNGGSPFSLLFQ